MTASTDGRDREKTTTKLPGWLHRELKVRAAELGVDIQDAVAAAIKIWLETEYAGPVIDTSGAESFSTYLLAQLYDDFKARCAARGTSYIQGIAQAVRRWLDAHPSAGPAPGIPQRKIVTNQKGGVGKTDIAGGVAQGLAEDGKRVLLVDYDPQGHLSIRLSVQQPGPGDDTLSLHMSSEAKGGIGDLVFVLPQDRFGGRLHVIPASKDAFLLESRLSRVRGKEMALERALAPIEDQYDVVVVDCPPSLGLAVDAAIYYGRRRDGEAKGVSGVLIPVEAEDSSSDAFNMLMDQIVELCTDMKVSVDNLGLVVNKYDPRRGYIATSSLANWRALGDPPVVAVIPDLKELREARRADQPILEYAPDSVQANALRELARVIS
jgi:chromosome partitioning protein